MIRGIHAMFFLPEAVQLREFFRDKLGLDYFDAGEGWLIFRAPEAEIGCHPGEERFQNISLYCDDIESALAELAAKGVELGRPPETREYGISATIKAPGFEIELYQPNYIPAP